MGFEGVIVLIFIIVSAIASLAKKLREQREQREERQMPPRSRRDEMSERARGTIYGDQVVREARPKGSPPPLPAQQSEPPIAPGRLLIEALLGQSPVEEAEEEDEWVPVAPPQRKELARPAEQLRRPREQPRHRPDMQRAERAKPPEMQTHLESPKEHQRWHTVQQRSSAEDQARKRRLEAEEERRQKIEATRARRRAQAAQRRTSTPQKDAAARKAARHPLLAGLSDVRRAIVFAEILGPPRAYQEDIRDTSHF